MLKFRSLPILQIAICRKDPNLVDIDTGSWRQIFACSYRAGLKVDDPGHLGHFLVGQVGLIHKLNYLDVTRISHVL